MKKLINIASEEKPLMIDAASVTGVQVWPEKKELSIYNEKGQLLWINYEQWKVDPGTLADKLAAAGNRMVSFPMRDEGKEYPHYIAPSAVTFATVTEVTKDGTIGAIVGVKGVGREESYGTKPEELQSLLDGMKKAGKTVLEFKPDVAHARWYNAAALYIDPAAVNEIRDDGYQVNVYFEASGALDVQTRLSSDQKNERENELLNKFWEESGKGDGSIQAAWKKASETVKEEENRARQGFADSVAAANGGLMKVPNKLHALYIRPDAFDYVTFHDDDRKDTQPEYRYAMMLQRQKTADNPYPEAMRAYFNSAAERQVSYEAIIAAEQPRPKAAKKKASGRKPSL